MVRTPKYRWYIVKDCRCPAVLGVGREGWRIMIVLIIAAVYWVCTMHQALCLALNYIISVIFQRVRGEGSHRRHPFTWRAKVPVSKLYFFSHVCCWYSQKESQWLLPMSFFLPSRTISPSSSLWDVFRVFIQLRWLKWTSVLIAYLFLPKLTNTLIAI